MVDMSNIGTFYKPTGTQSVIDRQGMARYVRRVALSAGMTRDLLTRQHALLDGAKDPRPIATCITREIAAWARADALLTNLNQNDATGRRQATLILIWTGIAAAAAYTNATAHVRPAPDDDAAVQAWFKKASQIIRAEFTPRDDRPPKERWLDMTANHSHFAGAAIGLIAVITQDKEAVNGMMQELRRSLVIAQPTGALPAEMKRGSRALHYQSFALLAISLMVAVADANDITLSPNLETKLSAIADFTLRSYKDPTIVEQSVGVPQVKAHEQAAWMYILVPHLRGTNPALCDKIVETVDKIGQLDTPLLALPTSALFPNPGSCSRR